MKTAIFIRLLLSWFIIASQSVDLRHLAASLVLDIVQILEVAIHLPNPKLTPMTKVLISACRFIRLF